MNRSAYVRLCLTNLYLRIGRALGYPAPTGRITLIMTVNDIQDVLITATGGVDAKGAPASLGTLTAAVDDTTHFSVAPDASGPNVFRVTRLPDASGDTAGVLNPKVTVTDTSNNVSSVFTFESDPSAETAISLTGVAALPLTAAPAAGTSTADTTSTAPAAP